MSARALRVGVVAGTGAAALALALVLVLPGQTVAQSTSACVGPLTPAGLPQPAAPPLRFGISPNVQAGQLGPTAATPVADDPARDLAALAGLRVPAAPFVLRLTRLFWSAGTAGIDQYVALARMYTQAGFEVELQVRYQPPSGEDGDIAAWLAYVRQVVDAFAPIPGVVGMQITNEVNFTVSPDSSDGSYTDAKDALIQGVIAAKAQARADGRPDIQMGFNWFYRSDPEDDQEFWTYLGQHGGPAFLAALNWVGLDAYPGTVYPPAEPTGGYGDGIVNALSVLRNCYMPMAGIPASVPIYIEENGYPTGPGRSDATQAEALEEMVQAVSAYRGTFNVTDYRWFNLRDADSSSANFQQQYGLLTSAYVPKPAYADYQHLVATLGAQPSAGAGGAGAAPRPPSRGASRLRLAVRDRRGPLRSRACVASAPVTLTLEGAGSHAVRRLEVAVVGPHVHVRALGPRSVRIGEQRLAWRRSRTVRVTPVSGGRRLTTLVVALRGCGRSASAA